MRRPTHRRLQYLDGGATPTEQNLFHTAAISGLLPTPSTKEFRFIGKTISPSGISDQFGAVGATLVMPTGIVFPAGAHLCMQIGNSQTPWEGQVIGYVQGYLTKNKK